MPVSFSILAVSQLAPATTIAAVSNILARARQGARSQRVTGLMVFDGAGFSHYIEGEHGAVMACVDHFRSDLRLQAFDVRQHRREEERRYGEFRSGYAHGEGPLPSETLRAMDGDAALEAFLALAEGFDLAR